MQRGRSESNFPETEHARHYIKIRETSNKYKIQKRQNLSTGLRFSIVRPSVPSDILILKGKTVDIYMQSGRSESKFPETEMPDTVNKYQKSKIYKKIPKRRNLRTGSRLSIVGPSVPSDILILRGKTLDIYMQSGRSESKFPETEMPDTVEISEI